MREYCKLHKDLSDAVSDTNIECPLCEALIRCEEALTRWATEHKEMKAELATLRSRPEVKAVMEEKS